MIIKGNKKPVGFNPPGGRGGGAVRLGDWGVENLGICILWLTYGLNFIKIGGI